MRPPTIVPLLSAFSLAAVITLGSAGLAASAAGSTSGVMPDGTVRYTYGRSPQPVLICKPHHVCDIMLESGENVLNMAIGDSAQWVIAGGQSGPSGTTPHVFVKPMQARLDTNLVITTTKRVYDVGLHSAEDAQHSRISFFYVDDDAVAKAAMAQHERLAVESVLAGTPLVGADRADAKYKVTGEATLTPDKVYNDGVRTFIVWKTLPTQLPAVVSIGKDGAATPINFRLVGSTYIVDDMNPNYDLVLAADKGNHGRAERRVSIRHL